MNSETEIMVDLPEIPHDVHISYILSKVYILPI